MRRLVTAAALAAAALVGAAGAGTPAEARFLGHALATPALVEQAQCVVRRERVRRPDGSVVVRTARRCGPGMGMARPRMDRCRVVRERVQRPNGNVVIRTARRCG